MTGQLDPSIADTELLELAQVVLEETGYLVVPGFISGTPYLLAEDPDNVVVLGAVLAVEDVVTIEPALSQTLVGRLAEGDPESKKWDAYVVILTSTHSDDTTTEALFSVTYNLSQVRRIVRTGVEPTRASIARSLRPILPLAESTGEAILTDPLAALEERLIADGLAPSQVSQAMGDFRAQTRFTTSVIQDPDSEEGYPGDSSGNEFDLDDEDG